MSKMHIANHVQEVRGERNRMKRLFLYWNMLKLSFMTVKASSVRASLFKLSYYKSITV